MTPTHNFKYSDLEIYIKRDDLFDPFVNGNKARKFYSFLTSQDNVSEVISHGSLHSNAMVALSYICLNKKIPFIYYTNRPQSFIDENSHLGNLKIAFDNKAQIISCEPSEYKELSTEISINSGLKKQTLYVVEGGASHHAEDGMYLLAKEISDWSYTNKITDFNVFIPSGTGSSAYYLQRHLTQTVFTTPVYKDSEFLFHAFSQFGIDTNLPTIISKNIKNKYGTLTQELYETITKIEKASDILFDRVYDPSGWQSIIDNHTKFNSKPLLYIHCGGTTTNEMVTNQLLKSTHV